MTRKIPPTLHCSCGGEVAIGYGYGCGPLGAYVVCEKCHHVFLILPDPDTSYRLVPGRLYERIDS